MRILCLDIGSGTQDILLMDTAQPVENAIQMVLPSPTVLVAGQINEATAKGDAILLTGETMGGGACAHALKKHLRAGFRVYAVPAAALSFDDNLEEVTSWGIKLVSPDEAAHLKVDRRIMMQDVRFDTLAQALSAWDIPLAPDVIAVAVLDHGTAPPGQSQRLSRFQYLESLVRQDDTMDSLIFTPDDLPEYFTRMESVARTVNAEIPLVLMDTGAAAVMGASLDTTVARYSHRLAVNLGNSHTIAFLMDDFKILGFFEHHTRRLSPDKLDSLLGRLISGDLPLMDVWNDGGHGSLTIAGGNQPFLVATGPRRSLLVSSPRHPWFAAPFGNMMLSGCFGLARAAARKLPAFRDEIEKALLAR